MITESEAREKWCPYVRKLAVFSTDGKRECVGAYNRSATDMDLPETNCIASDCMAWKWDRGLFEYQKHDHFYRWVEKKFLDTCDEELFTPKGDGWTLDDVHKFANGAAFSWKREKTGESRCGDCGLKRK